MKENGKTAVFITHSISEALEIGDRIVVLKRPAMIAYDVSFDKDTSPEERMLIRERIGEVLAAWLRRPGSVMTPCVLSSPEGACDSKSCESATPTAP